MKLKNLMKLFGKKPSPDAESSAPSPLQSNNRTVEHSNIQVLYVVGPRSNPEKLRYSLRSLVKFGQNLGRVIIAGYPPAWLVADLKPETCNLKLETLPVPDVSSRKQINILNCILKVIDAGLVDGDFLYSSDDHFLTAPADLAAWPFFYKADRLPTVDDLSRWNIPLNAYTRSIANTRALLDLNHLEPRAWHGHVNTHMHAADAAAVRALVRSAPLAIREFGFEPTCLFMAVRAAREKITPTFRPDLKLSHLPPNFDGSKVVGFSIASNALSDPGVSAYLSRAFPDPSPFEQPETCDLKPETSPLRVAYVLAYSGDRYARWCANAVASLRRHVPDAKIFVARLDNSEDAYFYRLRLPLSESLRRNFDRIVWIDCDVEITSPNFAMFAYTKTDAEVIACADPSQAHRKRHLNGQLNGEIAADKLAEDYCNDGVCCFNLAAIDPKSWTDRLSEVLEMHDRVHFQLRDQDCLYLMTKCAVAPSQFNTFWALSLPQQPTTNNQQPTTICAVHYTGNKRLRGGEAKRRLDARAASCTLQLPSSSASGILAEIQP